MLKSEWTLLHFFFQMFFYNVYRTSGGFVTVLKCAELSLLVDWLVDYLTLPVFPSGTDEDKVLTHAGLFGLPSCSNAVLSTFLINFYKIFAYYPSTSMHLIYLHIYTCLISLSLLSYNVPSLPFFPFPSIFSSWYIALLSLSDTSTFFFFTL